MPRKVFFKEINARHVSQECKDKRHDDCDGYVPRTEFNRHDHECDCRCHLTPSQRARIKVGNELDRRK